LPETLAFETGGQQFESIASGELGEFGDVRTTDVKQELDEIKDKLDVMREMLQAILSEGDNREGIV
jgi:hypothetical protein